MSGTEDDAVNDAENANRNSEDISTNEQDRNRLTNK